MGSFNSPNEGFIRLDNCQVAETKTIAAQMITRERERTFSSLSLPVLYWHLLPHQIFFSPPSNWCTCFAFAFHSLFFTFHHFNSTIFGSMSCTLYSHNHLILWGVIYLLGEAKKTAPGIANFFVCCAVVVA